VKELLLRLLSVFKAWYQPSSGAEDSVAYPCFTDGHIDMETQQRLCQKHALIFVPSLGNPVTTSQ